MTEVSLTRGIVAIKNAQGAIAGTGFLIDSDTIVTCAHVISRKKAKPEEVIAFAFQVIPGQPQGKAYVTHWWPDSGDVPKAGELEDIAVLTIHQGQTTAANALGFYPLTEQDMLNRKVQVFGFAQEQGEHANAYLKGYTGHGWVQMNAAEHSSFITHGFSGAPVWDNDNQAVVGMMVYRGSDRDGQPLTYMIPAAKLIKALQAVKQPFQTVKPKPKPTAKANVTASDGGIAIGESHNSTVQIIHHNGGATAAEKQQDKEWELEQRYLRRVIRDCGNLGWLASIRYQGEGVQCLTLDAVYTQLLTTHRKSKKGTRRGIDAESPPVSAVEMLDATPYLV